MWGLLAPGRARAHGVTGCTVPTCPPVRKQVAASGAHRPQAGPPCLAWWTVSGHTAHGPPDPSHPADPGSSGSLTQGTRPGTMGGLAPGLPGHPGRPGRQLTAPPQGTTGERCPEGYTPHRLCLPAAGERSPRLLRAGGGRLRSGLWLLGGVGAQAAGTVVLGDVCRRVPRLGFPCWFLPPEARVHFLSQVRRGGNRQASSQGSPGAAQGCCQLGLLPSTLAAPCWGSKQIPSSLGPGGGLWALQRLPLFHASDSGDMPLGPEVLRPASQCGRQAGPREETKDP